MPGNYELALLNQQVKLARIEAAKAYYGTSQKELSNALIEYRTLCRQRSCLLTRNKAA